MILIKEYLDYEDGDIKETKDGTYFDDLENNENVIDNDDIINNLPNEDKEQEHYNFQIKEEYNKDALNILKPTNKKFIDDNYVYKEEPIDNKKVKNKKKNKKKSKDILNKFIHIVLFIFRILFVLFMIFISLFLLNIYVSKDKNEEVTESSQEESSQSISIEIEEIQEIIEENPSKYEFYIEFIETYSNELTLIVNGENKIIENLKNGIITDKDAYNYFSKTLTKKNEIIKKIEKQEYPEEVSSLYAILNQMVVEATNNSKSIMNRYLVGDSYSKMILDMSNFYSKYLESLDLLEQYLGNL